jgi:hypothetical protein
MHIDRTVKLENGNRVRNFTIQYAGRNDDTSAVDSLVIDIGFVLVNVVTK